MKSKVSAACFVCCLVSFLIFSVTPCLALVTGTVKDTSGSPVSGALVTFTDESDADNEYSSYTDEEGKYSITFTSVSVKEEIPANFQLYQNYPNPFNPSTTIPFSLNEAGFVNLSIYNITGQKVRTLVDNYHFVGSHTVAWNGLDDSGKSTAAGIYIYQLKCGDTVESRKMLLIDGGSSGDFSGAKTTVMAKSVSDSENTTYRVTITGDDIETYEESGVIIVDGETYDFVIVRKTSVIQGITFVSIPGGTFRMGDVENYGQSSEEKPVHTVTLSSFEMSIYEITQGQYQSVMGTNPANSYGVGDNYPVYNVSWYDAVKFCNTLSDAAGLERCYNESTWACDFSKNGFRLPTEAEWEYACRAGTETNFYTGNAINSDGQTSTDLGKAGWYRNNWGQANYTTHVVGEKTPNAFGLFDMHGNVFEWCNDWYGSYTADSQTNPAGPSTGSYRVDRGGSWNEYARGCRSAIREGGGPTSTSYYLGFRVVRRP